MLTTCGCVRLLASSISSVYDSTGLLPTGSSALGRSCTAHPPPAAPQGAGGTNTQGRARTRPSNVAAEHTSMLGASRKCTKVACTKWGT